MSSTTHSVPSRQTVTPLWWRKAVLVIALAAVGTSLAVARPGVLADRGPAADLAFGTEANVESPLPTRATTPSTAPTVFIPSDGPVIVEPDRSAEDPQTALPEGPRLTLAPHPGSTSEGCRGGYTAEELNGAFATAGGGLAGADYARAQLLSDGRVLWVFQDVFIGDAADTLWSSEFVHNAGLVQDGSCYRVLHGGNGRSWLGGDVEDELEHWFWPLDSVVLDGDRIAQFVAEMRNPHGIGAARGAEPVAVWIATIDATDFTVVDLSPAPDAGDRPLYGFSITSDDEYHYLYGNCYRQFADEAWPGFHDAECGRHVYVARVPLGRVDLAPEYWTGAGWSMLRERAAPIDTSGQMANPMQVRRLGTMFVSVAKLDDWWGTEIAVEVSPAATGPFERIATVVSVNACDRCNTYFAHLLPWSDPDGRPLVVISNNAWDMARDAFPHPDLYRPSVLTLNPSAFSLEAGGQVSVS